jgi:hypothetical protein
MSPRYSPVSQSVSQPEMQSQATDGWINYNCSMVYHISIYASIMSLSRERGRGLPFSPVKWARAYGAAYRMPNEVFPPWPGYSYIPQREDYSADYSAVHSAACLPACLSACLCVCLSACLCVCLSVSWRRGWATARSRALPCWGGWLLLRCMCWDGEPRTCRRATITLRVHTGERGEGEPGLSRR